MHFNIKQFACKRFPMLTTKAPGVQKEHQSIDFDGKLGVHQYGLEVGWSENQDQIHKQFMIQSVGEIQKSKDLKATLRNEANHFKKQRTS